jgi:hypothetical protein
MLSARHHRDSKAPSRSFSLPEALCESGSDKMRELRNLSSNSLDEHQMSLSSARRRGDAEEENLVLAALMATEVEFEYRSSAASSSMSVSSAASSASSEDAEGEWEQTEKKRSKPNEDALPMISETPSFSDLFSHTSVG